MKLFRFKGGIHPNDKKDLTADCAIEALPLPKLLRIPLQQHIGAPAEPIVAKGDWVKKGDLLAVGQGMVSATIHAPTSGRIVGLGRYQAPHASGLPGRTLTLKPDGKDEWGETLPPMDPYAVDPSEIAKRVAACGVVGMGGATFPSAVKLNLRARYELHTLLINGAECEPYLTCDDRLMREHTAEVLDGILIMAQALGTPRVIIAVEANKPRAIAALRDAVGKRADASDAEVTVAKVPTQYPMGSEKHLVRTVTGLETPARALTADLGIVVHNTATAYAVHQAVRLGRPLIDRIVTVSGEAVVRRGNFRVLIGTTVADLVAHCGGFDGEPAKLLLGGPMMGQPLPDTKAPIVKGSNGVLALSEKEAAPRQAGACIRCASCVSACPCGLLPLEMASRIRAEELDSAVDIGLMDCVSCGSCAYICPSNIPLVQYFNYAKGRLTETQRAKHKQEETKRLATARTERMEKIAAEKRAAMEKRKAEQRAKKAAAEAAAQKESVSA
ncbi:MAG: electron transport complex subunit RsxC [Magnetospiraceae bacterium]